MNELYDVDCKNVKIIKSMIWRENTFRNDLQHSTLCNWIYYDGSL